MVNGMLPLTPQPLLWPPNCGSIFTSWFPHTFLSLFPSSHDSISSLLFLYEYEICVVAKYVHQEQYRLMIGYRQKRNELFIPTTSSQGGNSHWYTTVQSRRKYHHLAGAAGGSLPYYMTRSTALPTRLLTPLSCVQFSLHHVSLFPVSVIAAG